MTKTGVGVLRASLLDALRTGDTEQAAAAEYALASDVRPWVDALDTYARALARHNVCSYGHALDLIECRAGYVAEALCCEVEVVYIWLRAAKGIR